jgi:hypothetical protein
MIASRVGVLAESTGCEALVETSSYAAWGHLVEVSKSSFSDCCSVDFGFSSGGD